MSNRYLERVDGTLGPRALAVGLTSVGAASLAISLITLQVHLMMGSLVILGAGMTLVVRAPEPGSAVQARLLLDVGDIEGAETSAVALLRTRPAGVARGGALLLLGRCAEQRGDFAEAIEIFGLAAGATDGDEDLAEEVGERHAFALAAAGRQEESARELGMEASPLSPFRAAHAQPRPLRVRAEALVRHRRRDAAGVVALVERHGEGLVAQLHPRDRALLAVIHRIARERLGLAAPPLSPIDGRSLGWLCRMIPDAQKQFEQP